jgi:sugar O-acyltransferase (sialic acid O-acetyltransferase NeuD family)
MLTRVVIIGAGGFAREVQDVIRNCNRAQLRYNFLGFIDDFVPVGTKINDSSVIGDFSWFKTPEALCVLATVGVGAPEVRRKLVERVVELGVDFVTLVDPTVVASPFVTIGKGTVICPGVILTNNITLGEHVHLNLDSTVGHDAIMEDFTTTAPGAHINGKNLLKEGAYVGTGANFIEKVTVGEWAIIGAGACVVKDIPANTTAVGCPAKVIKTREKGWHLA